MVQIESAMGAAIEVFEGATAICVGRDRFLPVKTTNELLLLRSDVYELTGEGKLVVQTETTPEITLDPRYFKQVDKFCERIPSAPSLRRAKSLKVNGDWTFGVGVVVTGDVELGDEGSPQFIPDGTRLG